MVELMQTADLQLANFHTGTATYQSLNLLFCFLAVCALAYAEEVLNDATRCCEGWNGGSPEVSTVLGRGQDFSLILLPCWNDSLAAPTCLDFFFLTPLLKSVRYVQVFLHLFLNHEGIAQNIWGETSSSCCIVENYLRTQLQPCKQSPKMKFFFSVSQQCSAFLSHVTSFPKT